MGTMSASLVFENVCRVQKYFEIVDGRLKLVAGGIGFKESVSGNVSTVAKEDIVECTWQRCIREYQLCVKDKTQTRSVFQNLTKEDGLALRKYIAEHYGCAVATLDIASTGTNIGEITFEESAVVFVAGDRRGFEIPFDEIVNAAVQDKSDVAVELRQSETDQPTHKDYLAEIRFFVGDEQQDRAERICSTVRSGMKERDTAGRLLGTAQEISFLVPRGRYTVDVMEHRTRLRAKTHDHQLQNTMIQILFLLPVPDDVHVFFVAGLEPALRKGQTRYPYLVAQLDGPAEDRPEPDTEEPPARLPALLQQITGLEIIHDGTWKGASRTSCVKCSYKTNDGWLYLITSHLVFLPKPAIVIRLEDIGAVHVARFDSRSRTARTFDITLGLCSGQKLQMSNIKKNEYPYLEEYFQSKGIVFVVETETGEKEAVEDEESSQEEYTGGEESSEQLSEEGEESMTESETEDE